MVPVLAATTGLVLALPDLTRAQDDPTAAKVTLKQGDTIIFFGDSLTALAGHDAPKEHVTEGYVRIVRRRLQETHKDQGIQVDWVATGGHTVPDLLRRVDSDVIARKPEIVVIQIGCNDARRIPKETFQTSLERLIDKLQQSGIQVDEAEDGIGRTRSKAGGCGGSTMAASSPPKDTASHHQRVQGFEPRESTTTEIRPPSRERS
jgi:hypothetical protein